MGLRVQILRLRHLVVTKELRLKGSRMGLRLPAVVVILDVPMLRLMKFIVSRNRFLPPDVLILRLRQLVVLKALFLFCSLRDFRHS
jgi:hypothetical protein